MSTEIFKLDDSLVLAAKEPGLVLVTGSAGSGKTTQALAFGLHLATTGKVDGVLYMGSLAVVQDALRPVALLDTWTSNPTTSVVSDVAGRTLTGKCLVVDEAQHLSRPELAMVATRGGWVVLVGDYAQAEDKVPPLYDLEMLGELGRVRRLMRVHLRERHRDSSVSSAALQELLEERSLMRATGQIGWGASLLWPEWLVGLGYPLTSRSEEKVRKP